jgi:hypothetical protein
MITGIEFRRCILKPSNHVCPTRFLVCSKMTVHQCRPHDLRSNRPAAIRAIDSLIFASTNETKFHNILHSLWCVDRQSFCSASRFFCAQSFFKARGTTVPDQVRHTTRTCHTACSLCECGARASALTAAPHLHGTAPSRARRARDQPDRLADRPRRWRYGAPHARVSALPVRGCMWLEWYA